MKLIRNELFIMGKTIVMDLLIPFIILNYILQLLKHKEGFIRFDVFHYIIILLLASLCIWGILTPNHNWLGFGLGVSLLIIYAISILYYYHNIERIKTKGKEN